ncbi:phosphatidylinositol-3-phosphate-binding protein [Saccharomycopsis crataegensis]|uniref:Phosphatidylinositol-3-phosphate-binding protein n=1 Tax=Saccharomycopsis crataegensis TaxID=43959 RepID=A0AAV5QTD5_9ASCO|nr:phosphatidylinositol-3-phosphate-binding protein [Saccharomycopsis crataegensis]
MIRGIRKSLKGEKTERRASSASGGGSHSRMSSFNGSSSSSFTASLVASSSTSMSAQAASKETPKKIIKATSEYKAQAQGEISFQSGDFFWVVARENDQEFYEVCNPLTNIKGLVPVSHFEVMNQRKRPDSHNTKNNSFIISNLHLSNSPSSISTERFSNSSSRRPSFTNANSQTSNLGLGNNIGTPGQNGILYGVAMYDFEARADSDELDVTKGEYLILCAHHDFEWFIAKPINRLGGPGLVPVAYIKTLNLATKKMSSGDIVEEIKESGLPTVSEWKNKTAKYKATSINLTEEESHYMNNGGSNQFVQQQKTLYEYDDQVTTNSSINNSSNASQQNQHNSSQNSYSIFTSSPYDLETSSLNDKGVFVTDIKIDNFYYSKFDDKHGRYWYHVVAKLSNHKIRSLARYYDDFYEFQAQIKKNFASETSDPSIIPAFPPHYRAVDAQIAVDRFQQLSEYLSAIVHTPEDISKSKPVLMFFNLRDGVDKEFNEDDESIELPSVVGHNEDGQERLRLEAQSKEMVNNTQPPPSLNSSSARSSAVTKESSLSYQMGQLDLKTDSISTGNSEAAMTESKDDIVEGPELTNERPALKISTSTPSSPNPNNVTLLSAGASATPNAALLTAGSSISLSTNMKNVKVKFYYEDDIFAISVPASTTLLDLKTKIASRINYKLEKIKLFVKSKNVADFNDKDGEGDDASKEIDNDEFLTKLMLKDPKLKLIIITDENSG